MVNARRDWRELCQAGQRFARAGFAGWPALRKDRQIRVRKRGREPLYGSYMRQSANRERPKAGA